ncbi:hypothetical protein GFS60_06547 (plasmid) [Rhodococcus sp. WAY2]|nr:hypothetical protein GFS60_06547 [Rhodococcus sp. WAY2]
MSARVHRRTDDHADQYGHGNNSGITPIAYPPIPELGHPNIVL